MAICAVIAAVLAISFSNMGAASAAGLPGPLPGSLFEGGDGNLTVDTTGNTDWANVSGVNIGIDLPGGTSDNSFGQGAKEDSLVPTIVTGSIPPNKNDLTRFYEASEFTNNSNYLYLAWERLVNIGSADIDFEINQNQCTAQNQTGCTSNGVTTTRTAGDLLVLFEFSGSGTPTIQLSQWVTTGAGSQCEASSTVPCWSAVTTLNASQAEAAVNTGSVTDPLNNNASLGVGLFGEAAINLTAANVFQPGVCEHFGSAYTKARSSGSSFDSALKDFIAPIPVNISNCGEIKIHKTSVPSGGTGFSYTTTGSSPLGGSFTLNDGGTKDFTNVPQGSYSVTESAKTGWDLTNLSCTASGSGTSVTPNGSSTSTATASITMAAGGLADCTYTNHVHASPSIATTLSSTTINTGGSASDSAKLSNATFDAGGKVTYSVYTDSACTQGQQSAGTVTVTSGVVPDSNAITFNTAGTYYWQAAYTGDAHNDTATSACTSEILVVKTNPSIATTLSTSVPIAIGASASDSATLSNTTSDASGTVVYSVYTDSACTQGKQSAGTVTVANGAVPDSNAVTFNSAGTYYWQAVYSGDAKNNGATSVCGTEVLTVNKNAPGINTAQTLLPNDSATISGATSNAGGTVTFSLFDPSAATCSGTPAYTETVNVSGNGSYSTSNTKFLASTVGTWRWLVVYSGDSNNQGTTSACGVENFTLTN